MKRILTSFVLIYFTLFIHAQTGSVKGLIVNKSNREALTGVNIILYESYKGTITGVDGEFLLEKLHAGSLTLHISYIGYVVREFSIEVKEDETIDLGTIELEAYSVGLDEIKIISALARDRYTPVAVSCIGTKEIQTKLGNQEFPEILRHTPSVYVTKEGGGYGDSRINVRGFDQRNTVVMVNGVPVNDMENGRMFWANWVGLADIASQVQVQRGLGASKLAIPSVGGTINIITNAAEMKKGGNFSFEIGNDNYNKYALMLSTGLGEKGWAFTLQGAHTRGDGYADGTQFRGYSYFASVSKTFNKKHTILLTGLGAPQWHHQRKYGSYDGVNYITLLGENGLGTKFNPKWGTYNGSNLKDKEFSWRKNTYHKPKIYLNHYWNISDRTMLNTSVYASFGRGGSTDGLGRLNGNYYNSAVFLGDMGVNWNAIEEWNSGEPVGTFSDDQVPWQGPGETANPDYAGLNAGQSIAESGRNGLIRHTAMNNHNWYGVISNMSHKLNKNLKLTMGVDGRKYKGIHYRRLENKLGLDAYFDDDDINNPEHYVTTEGKSDDNKIDYYNLGLINWLGLYTQVEYVNHYLSAFVSVSGSNQSFKRIDYFNYSDSDPYQKTEWQNFLGGNIKTGINYNINSYHNVFINGGFISKQPIFENVFLNYLNDINPNSKNQEIHAFEAGYGIRYSTLSANVNVYSTKWQNRQISRSSEIDVGGGVLIDGVAHFDNIEQLHQGVEVDFTFKPVRILSVSGMFSVGNWRYTDNFKATIVPEDAEYKDRTEELTLYMKDVLVPDAAQTTFSLEAICHPLKHLNLFLSYYYAGRLYADFDVADEMAFIEPGILSWRLPDYNLFDAGFNYSFQLLSTEIVWNLNVNNILNTEYISESESNILYDASNNDDAMYGALGENGSPRNRVYFGFGRTWQTGFKIRF